MKAGGPHGGRGPEGHAARATLADPSTAIELIASSNSLRQCGPSMPPRSFRGGSARGLALEPLDGCDPKLGRGGRGTSQSGALYHRHRGIGRGEPQLNVASIRWSPPKPTAALAGLESAPADQDAEPSSLLDLDSRRARSLRSSRVARSSSGRRAARPKLNEAPSSSSASASWTSRKTLPA